MRAPLLSQVDFILKRDCFLHELASHRTPEAFAPNGQFDEINESAKKEYQIDPEPRI